MDTLLSMLGLGFGPSTFDVRCAEQKFIDYTASMIVAGMARAGDKPDTIRKNVHTATEYAKVIMENSKAAFEVARREQKSEEFQKKVDDARKVVSDYDKALANAQIRLSELEKVHSDSILWHEANQQAMKNYQGLAMQLEEAKRRLKLAEDELAEMMK